jgi:hypothetical protein
MPSVRQSIFLKVLAHVPTDFFHCRHCEQLFDVAGIGAQVHQKIQTAYPPETLEEADRLTTWLQGLTAQYGEQLHIHIVDPQSGEGLFKSLRHWIRHYPAFIVNRRNRITGWDLTNVERLLADQTPSNGEA